MLDRSSRRKSAKVSTTSPKARRRENTKPPGRRRHGVVLTDEDKQRMMRFVERWRNETKVANPHRFPVMWPYRKVKPTPELEEFEWILSKSTPSERYLAKFRESSPISSGSAYVNVFGSALRKAMSDQKVAGTILQDIWRKLPWEYLNMCENYYRRKLNDGQCDSQPFPDAESDEEENQIAPDEDSKPKQPSPSPSPPPSRTDDSGLHVLRRDNTDNGVSTSTSSATNHPQPLFDITAPSGDHVDSSVAWDRFRILPLLGLHDPFEPPLYLGYHVPSTTSDTPITTFDESLSTTGHSYFPDILSSEVSWIDTTLPQVSQERRSMQSSPAQESSMNLVPLEGVVPNSSTATSFINNTTQTGYYPTYPHTFSYNTTFTLFHDHVMVPYPEPSPTNDGTQ